MSLEYGFRGPMMNYKSNGPSADRHTLDQMILYYQHENQQYKSSILSLNGYIEGLKILYQSQIESQAKEIRDLRQQLKMATAENKSGYPSPSASALGIDCKAANYGPVFNSMSSIQLPSLKGQEVELKRKPPRRNTEESYQCSKCPEKFGLKSQLNNHVAASHAGIKMFQCDYCPKTCTTKQLITNHINGNHLNKKPFKCDVCAKTFVSKQNMTAHRDRIHMKKRPFKCKNCAKEYFSKYDYSKHSC